MGGGLQNPGPSSVPLHRLRRRKPQTATTRTTHLSENRTTKSVSLSEHAAGSVKNELTTLNAPNEL